MRRPAIRGVPDRLLSRTPGRRLIAALCAIGAAALAAGAIIGAGLPGSSQGASPRPKSSGASTVQRRDLVATDTESGTLSYATPQTVFNRMSGTITSLPSVGQVISPGGTLYQVDGQPIVLMNGSFPAYRDLSPAVSDGQDVLELNQNLVNLGFDAGRQITVDTVWQAATTSAVERWQASVGETQTGTVTLGQIVFLPGQQRITAVNTTLGSTGGSASSGSGSGAGTTASTTVTPRTEFVSLTTTKTTASAAQRSPSTSTSAATDPSTTQCPKPPTTPNTHKKKPKSTCPAGKSTSATPAQQLAALIALLKAETLELQKTKSTGASASSKASKPASTSATSSSRSGGGASAGSGSGSSGAGASGAGASGGSGAAASGASGAGSGSTAQAIMTTSSTQLVVTVNLDATKQSEAVVGEPVTVQLPTGGTVDGKISKVSPVAQTSSSSSSGSGAAAGAGGSSSTPTATIPVTITLAGHQATGGLDQAAVSVNFQQQKATGVLSVPVTALLATAGGGYAVQEAAAPHSLLPVSPGLFAAGYVQISGSNIFPGLQVTDSQG